MDRTYNPNQTVLFPDLFDDITLPSITTLPDFDHALENFIRLADFGAFIQLNFSGIDKSFSLKLSELKIPRKYLSKSRALTSPAFHLFPDDVRNQLNRMKYEVKSFFTKNNSIKTSFGYFLFRNFFLKWDLHRRKVLDDITEFLLNEIGAESYNRYFERIWTAGSDWIKSNLNKRNPYLIQDYTFLVIEKDRKRLEKAGATLYHLDRKEPEFLHNSLIIKTLHIPHTLSDYVNGISVFSTFKTIHLEYLKTVKIESIEDIKSLFSSLQRK